MDSRTEVEAAPREPAPSQGAFRPLWVAPQTGRAQAATEQLPVGIRMKVQKKTPPPFLSEQECRSPPHSCTESFELGGDDVPPLEDHEESDGSFKRPFQPSRITHHKRQRAPQMLMPQRPLPQHRVCQLPSSWKMGVCSLPAPWSVSQRCIPIGRWR